MIRKLEIENFQSHEKSILEFDEGVNVIVGSSDSGKTAIIRALRWIVWNRPSGEAIRSYWGGTTSVSVTADEGTVVRAKDKVDSYHIHYPDSSVQDFKAIGTSVPEEVSGLLNISEVNLQGQLDSPFLLSDSPGQVALHFNKIAHLDVIDKAISNINSSIRELKGKIKHYTEDVQEQQNHLKLFDNLPKYETEVEVLEQMESQLFSAHQGVGKLKSYISRIDQIDDKIEYEEYLPSLEQDVDKLIGQSEEITRLKNQINSLTEELNQITEIDDEIDSYVDIDAVLKQIDVCLVKNQELGALQAERSNLKAVIRGITDLGVIVQESSETIIQLEKQFNDAMGDICPLCNQPIKNHKL